jgi:hypothetical protein
MTARLADLLEQVLEGEPELGDEVDAVFRRADGLRRRRTRRLLAAGAATAAAIALAGYLLTAALLPAAPAKAPAVAAPSVVPLPSAIADPVLAVIAPEIDGLGMRILPRPPERGAGWRQYSVLDPAGRPRGTIEVAVYAVPDGLCFPVPAADGVCARPERTAGDVEYVRYDDDHDMDWQVRQTIARRAPGGRTVVVMATGERGTDDADGGRPPLTGAQVQRLATDARLAAAFGPAENCGGPAAGACPVFRVPVPTAS